MNFMSLPPFQSPDNPTNTTQPEEDCEKRALEDVNVKFSDEQSLPECYVHNYLSASIEASNDLPSQTPPVKAETDVYSLDINRPMLQPLPAMPQIWAQSRQEICEGFDWFRSYQSGVYYANNLVKGYLLSGFPAKRDGFFKNGKLIISHGGGKAESLQQLEGQIKMKAADDQRAEDKSVRALLFNYVQQIPLALLIDDRYALFPFDLGGKNIAYAVLGFYQITSAVSEREITKSGRAHVRFKFAFQWHEDQGKPWWHATEDQTMDHFPIPINPVPAPLLQDTIPDGTLAANDTRTTEMDYEDMNISSDDKEITTDVWAPPTVSNPSQASKRARRRVPVLKSRYLLSERRPGFGDRAQICMLCEKPSPLVFTEGWGCLEATCPHFWTLPDKGFSSFSENLEFDEEFLQLRPLPPLDAGFRNILPSPPITHPSNKITTTQPFTRGMHCTKCGRLSCRFRWQHWECSNCLSIIPVAGSIRRADELKTISTGVAFERNFLRKGTGIIQKPQKPLGNEGVEGHVQTYELPEGKGRIHHILYSSRGIVPNTMDDLFEEYQRQASDGSLPFRRWPLRSHKLRGSLLTNYFSQNTGEPYHYVGGAANTLPWDRAPSAVVKAKAFIEKRTELALQKCIQFNEVLSAAYMDKQKMSFHTDDEKGLGEVVAGLSLGSPALMHFRRRDVKHGPERRTCLSVVLRHGDVLVMDGAGVQQYYEYGFFFFFRFSNSNIETHARHMVEPTSFRIAATARWINPNRT
ncbi:hypothetical protein GYMLUDRAFT_257086 [Collybiopsis luxurians FD-317 M1]|nr:hypothetical protein GYMLUDRAFT_257086 [Collybiopsis luxurians FD-317 M1]